MNRLKKVRFSTCGDFHKQNKFLILWLTIFFRISWKWRKLYSASYHRELETELLVLLGILKFTRIVYFSWFWFLNWNIYWRDVAVKLNRMSMTMTLSYAFMSLLYVIANAFDVCVHVYSSFRCCVTCVLHVPYRIVKSRVKYYSWIRNPTIIHLTHLPLAFRACPHQHVTTSSTWTVL